MNQLRTRTTGLSYESKSEPVKLNYLTNQFRTRTTELSYESK